MSTFKNKIKKIIFFVSTLLDCYICTVNQTSKTQNKIPQKHKMKCPKNTKYILTKSAVNTIINKK